MPPLLARAARLRFSITKTAVSVSIGPNPVGDVLHSCHTTGSWNFLLQLNQRVQVDLQCTVIGRKINTVPAVVTSGVVCTSAGSLFIFGPHRTGSVCLSVSWSQWCTMQKRLNRSICRLGLTYVCPWNHTLQGKSTILEDCPAHWKALGVTAAVYVAKNQ